MMDSPLFLCVLLVGAVCLMIPLGAWCLREPSRAFLLVVLSTPFVVNRSHHPVFMRVGLPEIVFVFFAFVWFWSLAARRRPRRPLGPVHALAGGLLLVAGLSFVGADPEHFNSGLVEVAILGYLVAFCLIADQFLNDEADIRRVLDVWMLAGAIVAVIGLYECLAATFGLPRLNPYRDPYRVIATFRRPPQLGVYALSTFFVAVAYSTLPDLPLRKRGALYLLAAAMVVLTLFSSRRSALLAMAAGMALIVITSAGRLRRVFLLGTVFVGALLGAHALASANPKLHDYLSNRLTILVSPDVVDTPFITSNFSDAVNAFDRSPALGIGYGHFAGSEYSSTSNEVHSTPLRLLAECGIAGIVAYAALTGAFLFLAWRSIRLARGTPWAGFTQVFLPGLLALQVSYLYNRALRDRTYWLTIALVVAIHRMLSEWHRTHPPPEEEPEQEAEE